jgi:membrane associated rhomboid family serine protease
VARGAGNRDGAGFDRTPPRLSFGEGEAAPRRRLRSPVKPAPRPGDNSRQMYYFLYVPVGTELETRRPPQTVVALLVLNTLWFLLFHYWPPLAARQWALAFDASAPSLVTAFTSCFLHADGFHLLGNMVYLATLGPALEERIGPWRFLILYLAAGLFGVSVQAEAWRLGWFGTTEPLVLGASGAIAGMLGVFVVRCGFARVRVAHATLALVQGQARFGTTPINGYVAVLAWTGLQLAWALVSGALGVSRTAHAAHLGGLASGLVLALALGFHGDGAVENLLVRARRYARRGEHFAASGELATFLRRRPADAEAWLEAARLERILGRHRDAVHAFHRGISLLWMAREREAAVKAAREMRRHYPGARLRPSLLYRLALVLERSGDLGWASHTFEDFARFYPRHDRAPRALRKAALIESRRRNDMARARHLYEKLLAEYPESGPAAAAARELIAVSAILANRARAAS